MSIDHQSETLSAVVLMFGLAFLPSTVLADQQHCPASTPENSHVVCAKGCDPDADKARLEFLAKQILKTKVPVCLLARVDPKDRGFSRKLALKRVLWVRDSLIEHGVGRDRIAVELRSFRPETDKVTVQSIDIILDQ